MENEQRITIYDLKTIAEEIAERSESKALFDSKLNGDYLISNVETSTLEELGFEYKGMTNDAGFKTPLFVLGNLEAIYIDQILHLSKIN